MCLLLFARHDVPVCAREQGARTTLATVGELDQAGLGAALKSWAVKAPETGNDITDPKPFKLMFQVAAVNV